MGSGFFNTSAIAGSWIGSTKRISSSGARPSLDEPDAVVDRFHLPRKRGTTSPETTMRAKTRSRAVAHALAQVRHFGLSAAFDDLEPEFGT